MPRPAPGDRSHLQKKVLLTGYPEMDGDKFNPSDYILDQLAFRGEISDLMQRMFVPPLIMTGLALSNSANDLLVSNGAVYAEIPYDTVVPHNNNGAALTSLPQTGILGIANGVSLILDIPSSGAIGDNSTLNTVRAKVVWLDGELRNKQSNPLTTYSYVRKARLEIAINPATPANYPIQLGQFQCTIVGPNVTTFTVVAGARSEDFHFQFEKAPTSEVDAVNGNELMRLSQFLAIFSTAISDTPLWNETLTAPSARAVEDRFVDNVSNESIAGVKTLTNTTESTDKDTGGLITEGGLGVEKRINAGGRIASGTTAEGNLPPASNNDLTRKDWIEQRATSYRRQTIISGRKGPVHADFLEAAATGLTVTAKADSTTPIISSIAAGFHTDGQQKDYINRTIADKVFSGLTALATNFLGLKRVNATQVDAVATVLPPVYGSILHSDRENKINASFNGTNGDTEFIDPYGNMFRCYGSGWQISNINQYSGMNTLRCAGPNNSPSTNRCEYIPNFNIRSLEQWTMEFFFNVDSTSTPTSQFLVGITNGPSRCLSLHLHPTNGLTFNLSSNESTMNIWGDSLLNAMSAVASRTGFGGIAATTGLISPAQWYHVAWVFDGLAHKVYLNGYLIMDTKAFHLSEVFNYLKIANPAKIYLGAYPVAFPSNTTEGNISNFAFHPYVKYQTKKTWTGGDAPSARDAFTPPSVPIILSSQEDRYFEQAEAIYLDFESASDGDTFVKDKYGRSLVAYGNSNNTVTSGVYIESGSAKFGTKSLRCNGDATFANAAYIKAPVWADKWTVELWSMDNLLTAPYKTHVSLVVPNLGLGGYGFQILSEGNGTNIRYTFQLSSADASAGFISFSTTYIYSSAVYNHLAVTYDGITYRCFVNGNLVTSAVSQLRVTAGEYFCLGRHESNIYHLNGKIDDFAYLPQCKYTANFTPPVAALSASMPEQYIFDTNKMQMYKGYPTAFVAENTVFIGEVLASALNIERAISYALNGEYRERFASDFVTSGLFAFMQTRRHNIGVTGITGIARAVANGAYLTGTDGEVMDIQTYYTTAVFSFNPYSTVNRLLFGIRAGANGFVVPLYTGTGAAFYGGSGQEKADLLVEVKRSF